MCTVQVDLVCHSAFGPLAQVEITSCAIRFRWKAVNKGNPMNGNRAVAITGVGSRNTGFVLT